MQLTSDIRNRDITLEFLAESEHAAHRQRLEKERSSYQRQFARNGAPLERARFLRQVAHRLSLGAV